MSSFNFFEILNKYKAYENTYTVASLMVWHKNKKN